MPCLLSISPLPGAVTLQLTLLSQRPKAIIKQDDVLIYNSQAARFVSKQSQLQPHYQAQAWLLFMQL